MKKRWIGVAATALMISAMPAWASEASASTSPVLAGKKLHRKSAAEFTASAWAALGKGDAARAVQDAEAAAMLTPRDSGARALLGRAYLAAGRFRSAETAYGDALMLDPSQGRAAVNRALAQIALGHPDAARASLAAAQGTAPDSDIGLALALLGDVEVARDRLIAAARAPDADARTRQNLGLAYALEGRWTDAAAIAQQDVPADLMPQRLRRWAMISQLKADPAMQVGAILGVPPVQDAGQPTELALAAPLEPVTPAAPVVLAEASPIQLSIATLVAPVIPIAANDTGSVVTQTAITPPPLEKLAALPAVTPPAPIVAPPAPVVLAAVEVAPAVQAWAGPPSMRARKTARIIEIKAPRAEPAVRVASVTPKAIRLVKTVVAPSPKPVVLASQTRLKTLTKATGRWTVQLGAYSSAARTEVAWGRLRSRAAFLKAHMPTGSGIRQGKAMLYRLSVGGFATQAEATRLCFQIKAAGGACFIRRTLGDQPLTWALRNRNVEPA